MRDHYSLTVNPAFFPSILDLIESISQTDYKLSALSGTLFCAGG